MRIRNPLRIRTVTVLEGFAVRLGLTDGSERVLDLAPYVRGGGVFERIEKDSEYFRRVRVEGGTLAWPNDVDICPDVLIYGLRPTSWDDDPDAPPPSPH